MRVVALPVDRAVGVDYIEVEGMIDAVDREEKTIEVTPYPVGDNVLLKGFPFDYLERVLSDMDPFDDVAITAGDCVTVVYFEEEKKEKVINRAVALTRYCKQCAEFCYENPDGILIVEIEDDGDAYPVNKNPAEDDPGDTHQHRKDN